MKCSLPPLLLLSLVAVTHSFSLSSTLLPLRQTLLDNARGCSFPTCSRRSTLSRTTLMSSVEERGSPVWSWSDPFKLPEAWRSSVVAAVKTGLTALAAVLLLVLPLSAFAGTSESGGRLGGGSFYNRAEPAPPSYSEQSSPTVIYAPQNQWGTERIMTPSAPVSVKDEPGSALVFAGIAGAIAYQSMRSGSKSEGSGSGDLNVVKLQVALYCADRGSSSVLGKINSLAANTDTASQEGLESMVSSVSLALLRSKDTWISAKVTTSSFSDVSKAERAMAEATMTERAKIERETVNKRDGKDKSDPRKKEERLEAIGKGTAAIVTLVLGLDGHALPKVSDAEGLARALHELASLVETPQTSSPRPSPARIRSGSPSLESWGLLSAELLWTPEEAWETVVPEDIPLSYPDLIPF